MGRMFAKRSLILVCQAPLSKCMSNSVFSDEELEKGRLSRSFHDSRANGVLRKRRFGVGTDRRIWELFRLRGEEKFAKTKLEAARSKLPRPKRADGGKWMGGWLTPQVLCKIKSFQFGRLLRVSRSSCVLRLEPRSFANELRLEQS